jgi:chromosome segregation ATPase
MKDNTSEKILEIRVKYDDAIRKIAEYRTQLDILRKVEQTLKEDLKKGRMSREEYNIKLTENRVATQQYTDAIRVLNKQIQNERKEQTEMEGSLVRLRAELSNLTAAYDRLSRVEREGGRRQRAAR